METKPRRNTKSIIRRDSIANEMSKSPNCLLHLKSKGKRSKGITLKEDTSYLNLQGSFPANCHKTSDFLWVWKCLSSLLFTWLQENRKVFWCFQGVEKGCIVSKWVKSPQTSKQTLRISEIGYFDLIRRKIRNFKRLKDQSVMYIFAKKTLYNFAFFVLVKIPSR